MNPDITPDLTSAALSGANLSGTDLSGADLSGADLSWADLSWADLSWADLRNAKLSPANFIDSHLISRNLIWADLSHTSLTGANLSGTDLGMANLSMADLSMADLTGANRTAATLLSTNLSQATLNDADLSAVSIGLTKFTNNDLSFVKGMETAIHLAPSTIGVDTLYISNGKIPEVFLRGAGIPEDVITLVRSLVGRPTGFYSCFISYSHRDEEFSQQLHTPMRGENLRVWYAPEDMKGGRKLHEEIFSAIQIHDKLLLVLSEHSMKSEWVMTEIRRARKVERVENRKLFPIRLVDFDAIQKWECFDADSGKDLAVELREYNIPDFSNWKDADAFEAEFARLLRDLKATES